MPSHYGNSNSEPKKEMKKSDSNPAPKKKSNGMRKLSEKEKKLVREHFEKHEPDADGKRKAKVRMMLMRGKEVKSMKRLHKAVGKKD